MKAKTSLLNGPGCAVWPTLLATALACTLAPPARGDLTHRYSFTTDASDSVGGANGTPMNGATVSGGAATFGGGTSGPNCDYIELPPGLISNYTTVTFELWVDVGANGIWEEIYAFGNQTSGGAGANMVMFCPHSGSAPNDFRMSYAQTAPGYNDEYVLNGVGILDNLGPTTVACVYDPPHNAMSLYTNGVLVAFESPVTTGAKGFSLTNVFNVYSWLGRSLYDGDASYAGTLDEFRIYDKALGPLQVAVDNAAGPDTVVTNIAVKSIAWTVQTNMTVGSRQDTSVTFNTASYGSFTLQGSTEATYGTSDPTIATVTTSGRIFAAAVGTVSVSAGFNNQTNTVVLHIGNPVLVNRYSFTTDASDSVGGANGTLAGAATISNGAVVLPGGVASGDPTVSYVNLPPNLVTGLTAITIEAWATDLGSPNWARVWDLGDSAGGQGVSDGGSRYMFLSLPSGNGGGDLFEDIHINDRAGGDFGLEWVGQRPPVGKEAHLVWASDAALQTSWLYVNGAIVAMSTNTTLTPADVGPTVNDWLGRSQYNDPAFNGTIDEFRIWNGALSSLQVAINTAAGPDRVGPSDPGVLQAVRLNLNTTMINRAVQQATLYGDFAIVTNVNVSTLGATYASSDPTVATVDANGLIHALGTGTATVTATYGGKSDTRSLSVVAPVVTLAHRWNFNETSGTTVHDVVGTANGTLSATGATLDGTSVTLDGINGYVDLPGHLIDGFDAVTFEAWVNVDPNTVADSGARLFEFGSADAVNELGFTALAAGGNRGSASAQYYSPSANLSTMRHQGLDTLGKVHLVVTYDPPLGTIDFFLNGHWQNTVTNLSFSLAGITNPASRLGANLGGTDFTAVTIDDFRIYNGALDLFGIRANFAAGPNLVATNLGAPTSLTLKIDASMVQGSRSIPHAWASFASVTNVDVTQTADVAYSSSDSTVVSITPDGLVEAVGPGSATVTAALGGLKTAKPVTVFTTQTMLVHRYSFTSDASDSVGAQDGYLWGNATISGAQVVFDGDPNSYVELPSRMISSYDSVTFEFWASVGVNAIWSRIFDFGHYTAQADGGGQSYVFFTPHSGTPTTRICLSDGTEANLDCGPPLDGYDDVHLVVVYDPTTDTESLYTNAVLAASGGLAGKKLSGVNDVACWLGRSLYAADNGLTASIDEFRLYAGALTPAQITADYAAGPNTVVLPPPAPAAPALSASSSRGNIVITWPATATGFSLVSAPGLAAPVVWSPVGIAPVVTNGMNEVTVPTTNQAAYFRLKK